MTFSSTVMESKLRTTWKSPSDAQERTLLRPQPRNAPAIQPHLTGIRHHLTGDRIEQRSLARPIRPDQPKDLALFHLKADLDIGRHAAE